MTYMTYLFCNDMYQGLLYILLGWLAQMESCRFLDAKPISVLVLVIVD